MSVNRDGLSDPGAIMSLTDTCGAAVADYRLYPQCKIWLSYGEPVSEFTRYVK